MSRLSKRARRRLRGLTKSEPEIPTSGYYVVRKGKMFVATAWKFFTDPDFTMKCYAFEREKAIDMFIHSSYFTIWDERPDASEFKDWPAAARRA